MIITQTPLRISFFGGGTDFENFYRHQEGCVLSTTIDKYIFVIIKERFDPLIRIGYTRTEVVANVSEIQHDLVREAMLSAGLSRQVEIDTIGDIPSTGSGLGSSSAVTVGILNAIYTYLNQPHTQEALAREACKIEIERLNKPIGKQDQYIVAYGGLRFIRFLPDLSVQVENIQLSSSERRRLNEHLLLFYTNTARRSEAILQEQNTNILARMNELHELREMSIQGRTLLERGDFIEFGRLLHQGWVLKKKLASKISNPVIDEIYERARKAGAMGGKITGAGGGGYLLLFCKPEHRYSVQKALSSLSELPFSLEMDGSKVIFNYRRS